MLAQVTGLFFCHGPLQSGDKSNLCISLLRESVRVDGVGSASIIEVSFQEIPVTSEEDNQVELKVRDYYMYFKIL